jgi:hypothetical protein
MAPTVPHGFAITKQPQRAVDDVPVPADDAVKVVPDNVAVSVTLTAILAEEA